jgi:hypothetical protein
LVGTLITLLGFYLLYHITLGEKYGVIFGKFKKPKYFHFLIGGGISFLGLLFIFGGRVELVEFNKDV